MARFEDRITQLITQVGGGKLVGSVRVDQVYAKYQHERLDLKHPSGGGAKYLERPLYDESRGIMADLARNVLHGDLVAVMASGMEKVSRGVFEHAPFEFGDLKASGHPRVKDGGVIAYDRQPMRRRLTKTELRAKSHIRNLGFGNGR